jgi:hypothetical protein
MKKCARNPKLHSLPVTENLFESAKNAAEDFVKVEIDCKGEEIKFCGDYQTQGRFKCWRILKRLEVYWF